MLTARQESGEHISDLVTIDLDADGIDEDDAVQARGVSHREFRCDPAANLESDDHDIP